MLAGRCGQRLFIAHDTTPPQRHEALTQGRNIKEHLTGAAINKTRHGDCPHWNTRREVRGAIQRVHNPVSPALGNTLGPLFTENALTGCNRGQSLDQLCITPAITGRDQCAVWFDIRNDVAEIRALTLCNAIQQLMNGAQLV